MGGKLLGTDRINVGLEVVMVLIVHSVEVPEAGHADTQKVGSTEEPLSVLELHPCGIFHDGRSAGHGVATRLEGSERLIHPTPFGVPVGHRCH